MINSLFILLLAGPLAAQDQADEMMYNAYLSEKVAPEIWKAAVTVRKESWNKTQDPKAGFQLALAQFGLLSSTMRTQDEDLFDDYYKETEENLEKLISSNKKWAEPPALLSATYGLKMGYSPLQGMFLGAKSGNLIEKAKGLDPSSPLVWKINANSKYFTPEMWGGDIHEAIESYERCISLYESSPATLKFNWMYIDALAFMGQAYLKNGDTGKAIVTFEKALHVEPEFGWVKFVLLPKAKAKAGK